MSLRMPAPCLAEACRPRRYPSLSYGVCDTGPKRRLLNMQNAPF